MKGSRLRTTLSGLYAICDAGLLARRRVSLAAFAEQLRAANVQTVQLRCKDAPVAEVMAGAAVLKRVFAGTGCRLIMNDRADLASLAGFAGVHLGQEDCSPEDVRRMHAAAGSALHPRSDERLRSRFLVGLSTHTDTQVQAAEAGASDYVAVGPVFATGTKADAAPVIGLDGVRRARGLTTKPLVAIGGITRENAASVYAAGADAVAVISGLLPAQEPVEKVARDFIAIFR